MSLTSSLSGESFKSLTSHMVPPTTMASPTTMSKVPPTTWQAPSSLLHTSTLWFWHFSLKIQIVLGKKESQIYDKWKRTKKKTMLQVWIQICAERKGVLILDENMKYILDTGCLEEPYYGPVNIGTTRPRKIPSTCESRTRRSWGQKLNQKWSLSTSSFVDTVSCWCGPLSRWSWGEWVEYPPFPPMDCLHPSQSL